MSGRPWRWQGAIYDWLHPVAVFVSLLALYLYTMPPTVALEDDGMFILAAWYNGIAHPPGYPLFTVVAHLFTQLPWGSVAMRVHAVSALFGALACVALWGVARELGLTRGVATTIALMFGGSAIFWSQSIVAEVYSLNCLLLFLALYLVFRLRRCDAQDERPLVLLLGLTLGLGLANHWPLVILTGPGLLLLLAPRLRSLLRHFVPGMAALLLGLTPYIWLYLRSQQGPFISFYGPLRDLGDLFFVVSREGYGDVDSSPSAGWGDKLGFFRFFAGELGRQFSYLAIPPLLFGFWRQFARLRPEVAGALLWIFCANSLLLILLLGFDDEPLFHSVFRVYPLIAYGVAALWVGIGFAELLLWVGRYYAGRALPQIWTQSIGLLLAGASLTGNAADNMRQGYQWTELYAQQFFSTIEPDAAVFVDGDIEAGVIGYFRYVEGWRADVELYSSVGRIFGTRLFEPLAVPAEQYQPILDHFVAEAGRPVHYAGDFLEPPSGSIDNWLNRRVVRGLAKQTTVLPDPRPWFPYLERLMALSGERDFWTEMHRRLLLKGVVPHLANRIENAGSVEKAAPYRRYLERVMALSPGAELRWITEKIYRYPDPREAGTLIRRLERLAAEEGHLASKRERSLPCYLLGVLRERDGQRLVAAELYREAIRRWDHPENPAHAALVALEVGG